MLCDRLDIAVHYAALGSRKSSLPSHYSIDLSALMYQFILEYYSIKSMRFALS